MIANIPKSVLTRPEIAQASIWLKSIPFLTFALAIAGNAEILNLGIHAATRSSMDGFVIAWFLETFLVAGAWAWAGQVIQDLRHPNKDFNYEALFRNINAPHVARFFPWPTHLQSHVLEAASEADGIFWMHGDYQTAASTMRQDILPRLTTDEERELYIGLSTIEERCSRAANLVKELAKAGPGHDAEWQIAADLLVGSVKDGALLDAYITDIAAHTAAERTKAIVHESEQRIKELTNHAEQPIIYTGLPASLLEIMRKIEVAGEALDGSDDDHARFKANLPTYVKDTAEAYLAAAKSDPGRAETMANDQLSLILRSIEEGARADDSAFSKLEANKIFLEGKLGQRARS